MWEISATVYKSFRECLLKYMRKMISRIFFFTFIAFPVILAKLLSLIFFLIFCSLTIDDLKEMLNNVATTITILVTLF